MLKRELLGIRRHSASKGKRQWCWHAVVKLVFKADHLQTQCVTQSQCLLHPVEDSVNTNEHSKGNTQRKMLSDASRDTHYRNLRSWSKSTPQLKLKQMEDHRRFQDHSDMTSRMTSAPEKPSISWQVIMQGTLETLETKVANLFWFAPQLLQGKLLF